MRHSLAILPVTDFFRRELERLAHSEHRKTATDELQLLSSFELADFVLTVQQRYRTFETANARICI